MCCFVVFFSCFGWLSAFCLRLPHAFAADLCITSSINRQFVLDYEVFVSVPNPRSCDNLNTPLDALAAENVTSNDIKVIDINLKMCFIIFPSVF